MQFYGKVMKNNGHDGI